MRDGSRTAHIYETLRALIVDGELSPGSRLPPHRQLAARFEVAPMTIRQVLARLADERLVSSDIRLPEASDGIGFIRSVRTSWPGLPLAAMPSEPRDLDLLRALPEYPSLIVARPFQAYQIAEVLRLALQEPYWMTARPVS